MRWPSWRALLHPATAFFLRIRSNALTCMTRFNVYHAPINMLEYHDEFAEYQRNDYGLRPERGR